MKKVLLAALAALTLATACKKDDNPSTPTQQLSGTLSGANSIKPTSASTATGNVTGTYDPSSQTLNYTLTFTGLTGPPMMAHFHYGDPQHTGSIFIPLSGLPAGTSGTITGSRKLTTDPAVPAVPAVPATATTPAIPAKPAIPMAVQADSFKMGHVYANIHTAQYPAGEIRANVVVK